MSRFPAELFRVILVAAMVFQGVIGNAHLALAAADPDGTAALVICSGYGLDTRPADGSGTTPDSPVQLKCPACAGLQQAAGTALLPVADLGRPVLHESCWVDRVHDQRPEERKPRFTNSRAPPRSV